MSKPRPSHPQLPEEILTPLLACLPISDDPHLVTPEDLLRRWHNAPFRADCVRTLNLTSEQVGTIDRLHEELLQLDSCHRRAVELAAKMKTRFQSGIIRSEKQ